MRSFNEISLFRRLFPVCPKQRRKAFVYIYPRQSALSGSMLIFLEQLNGLAVWAIIHSNTFYLCWSIAKNIVRIEKVYLFHRGRRIWPQGQHHNKYSSDSIAFSKKKRQRKCQVVFPRMTLFFFFIFVILAIWSYHLFWNIVYPLK